MSTERLRRLGIVVPFPSLSLPLLVTHLVRGVSRSVALWTRPACRRGSPRAIDEYGNPSASDQATNSPVRTSEACPLPTV